MMLRQRAKLVGSTGSGAAQQRTDTAVKGRCAVDAVLCSRSLLPLRLSASRGAPCAAFRRLRRGCLVPFFVCVACCQLLRRTPLSRHGPPRVRRRLRQATSLAGSSAVARGPAPIDHRSRLHQGDRPEAIAACRSLLCSASSEPARISRQRKQHTQRNNTTRGRGDGG